MPFKVHPKEADRNREVVRAFLGSGFGWQAGLLLVGMAVGTNVVSSYLFDKGGGWAAACGLVLCLGVLWRVSRLARRAAESVETVVATNERPEKRKALVLFLSNPPKAEVLEEWMTLPEFRGGIQNPEVHERMRTWPWRMPVEAIAYHFGSVKQVIVICSSDQVRAEQTNPGTAREFPRFYELLTRLFASKFEPPKVVALHQLASVWKDASGRWNNGIDFEDAENLVAALLEIFRFLREENISRNEVVVDITGGTKVATVAGAAVSLGQGQKFQYISTQNHRICSYDVTYRRASE